MQMRQAILEIEADPAPKTYVLQPGRSNSFEEIHVDFQISDAQGGRRFTIFLHPKQDVVIRKLEVQLEAPLSAQTRFLANGYQSWSDTLWLSAVDRIPGLRKFARPFLSRYGDERIVGIPRGKGRAHSWTYTCLADGHPDITLLGSLSEHTGFTLFLLDWAQSNIVVRKDLENMHLSHSFPGLDFWVGQGRESMVFDTWFSLLHREAGVQLPQPEPSGPVLGWTSWYRYFDKISEADILQNTETIAASGLPFRYVQIDDGWQKAVGDWRTARAGFPNGMASVAAAIRSKGLVPGLWLAPFVASAKSDLARQHPDWLLRDKRGRPIRAGWNRGWGGWYFALDFYHPAVQDYLSGVFHVILEKWEFEFLKLDFLFAACLAPPPGKLRGQVMHDALEFLRRQLGRRQMLACGVPLAPAFGLADFCRVGGDIHLSWEHRLLAWLRHRERVSTLAALRSTLARWPLHGRAFRSDPDVFILRNYRQHLTDVQQNTVLTISALLGGVHFTSDDVGSYTPEQRFELEEALTWIGSRIIEVREREAGLFSIDFENAGERYVAFCNLSARSRAALDDRNGWATLKPYETVVLKSGITAGPNSN